MGGFYVIRKGTSTLRIVFVCVLVLASTFSWDSLAVLISYDIDSTYSRHGLWLASSTCVSAMMHHHWLH